MEEKAFKNKETQGPTNPDADKEKEKTGAFPLTQVKAN